MPRRSKLDCLLDDLQVEDAAFSAYERLFVSGRSRFCPSFFPAWKADDEPALCGGCQDILIRVHQGNGEGKRRLTEQCSDCGQWMKATRRSTVEPFFWWTRDYRWTVPTWSQDKRRDVIATDSLIARHLSWDLGKDFRLLSLRARDSDFLEWDQKDVGSSVIILDLDFKRLWSPDEVERFETEVSRDLASVKAGEVLHDYDATYAKFIEGARKIIEKLPVEPIAFRSSWSHGIHLYLFLDQAHPSVVINQRVRGFLQDHGLLDSAILDGTIHPHPTAALRLPLGFGSKLLDLRSLTPMFEGDDVMDQVPHALRWLAQREQNIPRVSLDRFGKRVLAAGQERRKPFDPSGALRAWEEGILRPGTRRHRTKSVILLGRHLDLYGAELDSFVNVWLASKHNGQSRDVNSIIRLDPDLTKLNLENAGLIDAIARKRRRMPKTLAPIPVRVLKEIVARVEKLDLKNPERFKVIEFAFEMHALADYFIWLTRAEPRAPVALAKRLWRKLHDRYDALRHHCERAGLVERASAPEFDCGSRGTGKAATWRFPLLDDVRPDEERVNLHEGLARIWGPKAQRENLTPHYLRRVRACAAIEGYGPRWGTGDVGARAARTLRASLEGGQESDGIAETGDAKSRSLGSREEANTENLETQVVGLVTSNSSSSQKSA